MNPTRWRIAALLVCAIAAQLLSGCGTPGTTIVTVNAPSPSFAVFATPVPAFATPGPLIVVPVNPTAERIQDRQTDAAGDRAASAAEATLTANQVRQTVVAEAHVIVAAEVTQTAQAAVATNAYPMQLTSAAATQTVLLVQQYQHEQDNFVNRIVTPLIPIMAAILFILLLFLVIALLKRQFLPGQWFNSARRTRDENVYPNSLVTIDGEVSDYYNHPPHPVNPPDLASETIPALPCEKLVYVEVVNANELPIVHWVDEVERQLAGDRGASI
jgi:hypothetical protein